MFSLIISIIAIALVAALALASIYYGGDAFQRGSADAEASTIVNQGQQIQAAVTMADVDEKFTDSTKLSELVGSDKYLKEMPKVRGNAWSFGTGDTLGMVVLTKKEGDVGISVPVCKAINKKFDGKDQAKIPDSVQVQAFGCYQAADAEPIAYYKL